MSRQVIGRTVAAIGDDDVAQPFLQIAQIARQTKDRHHFGGHGNVEPGLPREPVRNAAQAGHDVAQGPVVHVHHPAPCHPALVDIQRVAPVDMVVDHRRQQVVGTGDGVEIAGEMQVHVFHRHDLRIAAAGSTALHPETRAKRGFAQTDRGLLADPVQTVAKPHGGRGLAFAGRGRGDRGDKDQFAIRAVLDRIDEALADLGLVMAVRQQIV